MRMENHHPYADSRMQLENYYGGGGAKPSSNPNGLPEFRSYSVSRVSTEPPPPKRLKKGKSTNSSISKAVWCFSDPELQRKTRVASYKAYSVEGKMKGSFRKSFRWIKCRYSQLIHGW